MNFINGDMNQDLEGIIQDKLRLYIKELLESLVNNKNEFTFYLRENAK